MDLVNKSIDLSLALSGSKEAPKSINTALGYDVVAKPTIQESLVGYNFENIDKYRKFINEIYPNVNLERQAAANQSAGSKIGNMFVQGGVGEILAQGFIGGAGSLLELPVSLFEEIFNKDADFNNFFTKLADNISEELKETNPIFRYNPDKAFDWKDLGWWTGNFVSVFSTAGLFIPALGASKATGYFSKLLKTLSEASKTKAIRKGLGIASDITDTERYWQQLMTSSLAMRNAENMRESSQSFNTIRNEVLETISDDNEYNKLLSSEIGQEYIKEHKTATKTGLAEFIASKAAWKNYGMNAVNLVFDMMQLAPIFKPNKVITRAGLQSGKATAYQANLLTPVKQELGATGKSAVRAAAKSNVAALSFLKGSSIFIGEQVSEGAEELINAISQSDANWYGKYLLGKEKDSDFKDRLNEYLNDPSSWEQAFWGFLGGVTFSGGTRLYRSAKEMLFDEKNPYSADAKVEEIKNRFLIIAESKRKLDLINNGINPNNGTKLQGNDVEIANAINNLSKKELQSLGYSLGLNASRHGNIDLLLDMLKHPEFKTKLIELGITDENTFDTTLADLTQHVLDAETTYKQVYGKIFNSTVTKPWIREAILGKAVSIKNDINHYKKTYANIKTEISKLKNNNPAYDTLKEQNKDKDLDGTLENIVNSRVISFIDTYISSENNETRRKVLETRAEEIKNDIKAKRKELGDNEALGDFNSISDIIDKEVDAKLFEIFIQADNTKYEELLNTDKSIPIVEKQLKKEKNDRQEYQFRQFKDKINAEIKLDKENKDTAETIDAKIAKIDDYIKSIKETKIDPFAEANDPLAKLDNSRIELYTSSLTNTKQFLIEEKNRRLSQKSVSESIATSNQEIVDKLSDIFKTNELSTEPVKYTGKRDERIIALVENELRKAAAGTDNIYNTLLAIMQGNELSDVAKQNIKKDLTAVFNYFSKFNKLEELINEILLLSGYIADITLEDANKAVVSEHINNAAGFRAVNSDDNTKPAIDFTAQNPLTPLKVERANKWITGIINDSTNGDPLFNEFDHNGKPKNTFFKFKSIAAKFAKLVGAEVFREYYNDLKDAYEIISNATVNPETKTTRTYNTRKYVDNISADDIIHEFGIENINKEYEFNNIDYINETGGINSLNTFVFSGREVNYTILENGNIMVSSNEDADLLKLLLNQLDKNSPVIVQVNSEYSTQQEFSQNKNNPDLIPISVGVKSKDGITNISAIPTTNTIHHGIRYSFDGTDWIDKLSRDIKNTNIRLDLLSRLFPHIQSWYNSNKFDTITEANKQLEVLLKEDSFGIIFDLLGDINPRSTAGNKALMHICNVLFYGQSDTGTAPIEFNKQNVLQNVYNWKDKLYRDHINVKKIRKVIAANPDVTISSTISHITSGSVIIALDKNGNKVFNNLSIINSPGKVKLYKLDTKSHNKIIENVSDPNDTHVSIKPKYTHSLYVGVEGRDTTIPVPIYLNTLNGNLLSSPDGNALLTEVVRLIQEYGKIRVDKTDSVEINHTIATSIYEKIEEIFTIYHDGIARKNILNLSYKDARFITIDEQGREQVIIYNFYENSIKYNRIERKNGTDLLVEKNIDLAQFTKELGKLTRTVKYKNFSGNKYTDILGNTYNSYSEYLINTNVIVTDVGMVTDKDGNKISNFMPTAVNNKGGLPLAINIDTSNLDSNTKTSTFREFSNTFKLDSRYDFILAILDQLVISDNVKFNGIVTGQYSNRYAWYNVADKSISVNEKWVEAYKNNPTSATLILVHEILHSLIGSKSIEARTELLNALTTFRDELKNTEQYKALVSKPDKTEIDNKLLAIINDKDVEEILTYGLTDVDFAKFLDTVKTEKDNVTVSFWTRLKEIIRELANAFGITGTKLDELNTIFEQFITEQHYTGVVSDIGLTEDDWDFGDSDIDISEKLAVFSSNIPSANNLQEPIDLNDVTFVDDKTGEPCYGKTNKFRSDNFVIPTKSRNKIVNTSAGKMRASDAQRLFRGKIKDFNSLL
jgi:hypothetical protein